MYSAAMRISDGLLTSLIESPNLQNEAAAVANAVAALGGVAEDWKLAELTQEQYDTAMAGLPARAFLAGEAVTLAVPPQVSLSAATVEADGVTEVTLTVTIPDYAGPIKFVFTPPSPAEPTIGMLTAVAGVATAKFDTDMLGKHTIMVETEAHGVAWAEFVGI